MKTVGELVGVDVEPVADKRFKAVVYLEDVGFCGHFVQTCKVGNELQLVYLLVVVIPARISEFASNARLWYLHKLEISVEYITLAARCEHHIERFVRCGDEPSGAVLSEGDRVRRCVEFYNGKAAVLAQAPE